MRLWVVFCSLIVSANVCAVYFDGYTGFILGTLAFFAGYMALTEDGDEE